MGLLAGTGLRWEDGHPVDDDGRIPTSTEGNLYVDFVDPVKALANALPVSGFFQAPGYDVVRKTVHPNFKEKLAGGEIAVLVADAFTGSRFVDTPTGKVLSYFAVVSMMNGVLARKFIFPPFAVWTVLLLACPVLFLLLTRASAKTALSVTAAATLAWALASVVALLAVGWILPCVQLVMAAGAGWLLRLAHHLTVTLGEKMALSREMDMGRTVQGMLLPKERRGRIGAFEFQVLYQPYWSMAGDWFQVFQDEKDGVPRGIIAFGDGVGKGPSAALNTAVIAAAWASSRTAWRSGALDSPAFARTVDELVRATFAGEQCTTLSVVEIEGDAVRVGSCAAQRWLKFSFATKAIEVLKNPKSDLLGLGPEDLADPMQLRPVTVAPGDFLLGFTDGVFDGSAGLKRFANIVRDKMPEFEGEEIFGLVEQLATDSGRADVLPDDRTLVMIRLPVESVVGGAADAVDAEAPEQRYVV